MREPVKIPCCLHKSSGRLPLRGMLNPLWFMRWLGSMTKGRLPFYWTLEVEFCGKSNCKRTDVRQTTSTEGRQWKHQTCRKVKHAVRWIFLGKYNPKPKPNTHPHPNPNPDGRLRDINVPTFVVWNINVPKVDLLEQSIFCKSIIKHSRPCSRFNILGVDLPWSTLRRGSHWLI